MKVAIAPALQVAADRWAEEDERPSFWSIAYLDRFAGQWVFLSTNGGFGGKQVPSYPTERQAYAELTRQRIHGWSVVVDVNGDPMVCQVVRVWLVCQPSDDPRRHATERTPE